MSSLILEEIVSSCRSAVRASESVDINSEAIETFTSSLDQGQFEELAAPFGLPLKFDTDVQHINFWAWLDVLNIGSGFRHDLHKHCGRGAFQSIQYGVMSAHLGNNRLDVSYWAGLSRRDVSVLFNIPLDMEEKVQDAVYRTVPTPVAPLVDLILDIVTTTTNVLRAQGFDTLGAWIMKATEPAEGGEGRPRAGDLVAKLVETFPAFNDVGKVKDVNTLVLKKAQLLCADMYRRFRESHPAHFDFVDFAELTVFSDNVLPAVLRKLGIIELTPELEERIDARVDLEAGDDETAVRAAAVVACIDIVEKLGERGWSVTCAQLDMYLWATGKKKGFRSVERHATRNTIFY